MIATFPAVLIGGPPHSGKSTLTYRLSQALLKHGVEFYVLRASPDGEGNWSHEAPSRIVAELRMRAKSDWTAQFAEYISRDIANRHLPLIVDAGGKPSPETEQIARQCTHTVLLAANPTDLEPWRELVLRQGLPLIADLTSSLDAPQCVVQERPTLFGTVNGLTREQSSAGVCFDALVQRMRRIFAYETEELFYRHQRMTNIDMVLHIERAIYPLPAHMGENRWQLDELSPLLDSLPKNEPLAMYGRGPTWLYAALAAFAYPARCEVFDVRQGWVKPPTLVCTTNDDPSRMQWDDITECEKFMHIRMSLSGSYLDYREATQLPVPNVSPHKGVILDGKFPMWLWAALVRAYIAQPWVAVYRPQTHDAVVVWSQTDAVPVGTVLAG